MIVDPLVALTLRALLAVLFAAAAVHKLRAPARFADVLRGYRLLPRGVERAAAVVIGGVEAMVALAFVVPSTSWGPGSSAAVVLLAYTVAITINLVRGRRDVDCGCFGPVGRAQTLSEWLVVRNVVVIAAALVATAPVGSRALVSLDAFVGVATCVGAGLLWVGANQLMAQWPRMQLLRRPS